jgi:phage terminase large subunit GpA-like protein
MGGKSFPGPWTFKYHPWLKDMHDSDAQLNVGQKAAQMGYTETMLNLVFYHIDVNGTDCLYILPSKTPDATDFSSARFDPALELSDHLRKLFSDVQNVGHKSSGSANLYIRGSQSKAGLRSIPVGFMVIDEMSIMNQNNVALALERVSGQLEKQIWMISTPTIEDENINKEFLQSTQEHFYFKCPRCGQWEELIWPDSMKLIGEDITDPRVHESHLICTKTKLELPHIMGKDVRENAEAKASWLQDTKWIPTYSNRDKRGFLIPQLYSVTVTPGEIALSYFKGLTNPADEQEFFNSKLGVTHAVEGARVSDEQLAAAKSSHSNRDTPPRGLLTMGIDVGNKCHYEIDQWFFPKNFTVQYPEAAKCKVIRHGTVEDFAELDDLMKRYQISHCVIDSQPERRAALAFANRWHGFVNLCFYAKGITGKTISIPKDQAEYMITVDRTSWLDLSLGRFHNETILIPRDVDFEYREHIKAPTRIYNKDKDGNPVGSYESGTKPDHYAHARNYAEIAMMFTVSRGKSQNIGKVL